MQDSVRSGYLEFRELAVEAYILALVSLDAGQMCIARPDLETQTIQFRDALLSLQIPQLLLKLNNPSATCRILATETNARAR